MRALTWVSFLFVLGIFSLLISNILGKPCETVWPTPKSSSCDNKEYVLVNPQEFKFALSQNSESNQDVINDAFARYMELVFIAGNRPFSATDNSVISRLDIQVENLETPLSSEVDESYQIEITSSGSASLNAPTVWGMLHGLETFSQLVEWDDTEQRYKAAVAAIDDKPRFPWRGVMIDTSRHFMSVDYILHVIDALSYNKFNVLHWHITDAQSFPLEIKSFPKLHEFGSYAPEAIYRQSDVKKIVSHARFRGVRIVPEIDMPGHSKSWGKGYSGITSPCSKVRENNIPLNPANPLTLEIANSVLKEMTELFPDTYLHIGSDEVDSTCWEKSDDLSRLKSEKQLPSIKDAWGYFLSQVENTWSNQGKKMMCWAELFLKQGYYQIPSDSIVQVWLKREHLQKVVDAGYKAVYSAGNYLDVLMPNKGHYNYMDTWKDFYENEPTNYVSGPNENLIMGGEACMWAEQTDEHNWDERVWPRASAAAERLWRPKGSDNIYAVRKRLGWHRCRLVRRGVRSGAAWVDYCPVHYVRQFTPSSNKEEEVGVNDVDHPKRLRIHRVDFDSAQQLKRLKEMCPNSYCSPSSRTD
eukprot:gb/GECH01000590.1/.p1 GENE.gb/GECH01000590.1/~~gb/GECH01000590.1/.p1  ORF type:complete len:584 (+),score=102.63 gb/GECH01000590.1/:1-1752(+)